jgi:hypothetical protein
MKEEPGHCTQYGPGEIQTYYETSECIQKGTKNYDRRDHLAENAMHLTRQIYYSCKKRRS